MTSRSCIYSLRFEAGWSSVTLLVVDYGLRLLSCCWWPNRWTSLRFLVCKRAISEISTGGWGGGGDKSRRTIRHIPLKLNKFSGLVGTFTEGTPSIWKCMILVIWWSMLPHECTHRDDTYSTSTVCSIPKIQQDMGVDFRYLYAFDTVDHELLMTKLDYIGVRGHPLERQILSI